MYVQRVKLCPLERTSTGVQELTRLRDYRFSRLNEKSEQCRVAHTAGFVCFLLAESNGNVEAPLREASVLDAALALNFRQAAHTDLQPQLPKVSRNVFLSL